MTLQSRVTWALLAGYVLMGTASAPAQAEEIRLVGGETTYFCYRASGQAEDSASGPVCEIVQELARRLGYTTRLKLYPLQRALMMAATTPGVLAAPVGRIPAREQNYSWLVKLVEDEFVVVTRKDSKADISTVASVRSLCLGVIMQGAAVNLAQENGIGCLSPVTSDVTNALKLEHGRVDAWLSPWNAILASQRVAGLPTEGLRRGLVLSRVGIYLAGPRDLDPSVGVAWRAAFGEMVKDGSYERLLRQYHYEAPVPALPGAK